MSLTETVVAKMNSVVSWASNILECWWGFNIDLVGRADSDPSVDTT